MSISRHWTLHNAEPEPFIPPLSMLHGHGPSHSHAQPQSSHRRQAPTPVTISRVPSSQAIVDMNNANGSTTRPRPSPAGMPVMHPSYRPSNAPPPPPSRPPPHFAHPTHHHGPPPNPIPIPMAHRPRTIAPVQSRSPRDDEEFPQSYPPRYVPFNGTPGSLGLFEAQQLHAQSQQQPMTLSVEPRRERDRESTRERERERGRGREQEREDVVMLAASVEERDSLASGQVVDSIIKARQEKADQLWEEEQERLRKEVEEEQRRYEEEKALGIPHRSPASPLPPPNPMVTARSRSQSQTHISSYSMDSRHAHAPPTTIHDEIISTPPTVPSPTSQAATKCVSTKDEREKWRREIRQVIEEQVRRQCMAKEEAEKSMREAEENLRRIEKERRELEQVVVEVDEDDMDQEESEPEIQEMRRRRRSSVSTKAAKSRTKSVMSSSTRADHQKRREQKDARRWARRREDERKQSRFFRRSQRIGSRRFTDRSDAWSRSGAGGPFHARPKSIAGRSRPQSQIGLDAGLDAFGFGIYQSDGEALGAEDVSETCGEEQESEEFEYDNEAERAIAAWNSYESRWNNIFKNPPAANSLRFVDIPWPTANSLPVPPAHSPLKSLPPSSAQISGILNERTISEFLLSSHHSRNKSDRLRIRSALLKYHPDRVMRWGNLVQESERMAVVMGAEIVVRCLNEIMEKLSDDPTDSS